MQAGLSFCSHMANKGFLGKANNEDAQFVHANHQTFTNINIDYHNSIYSNYRHGIGN